MPAYTFKCKKCKQIFDVEHSMKDPHPTVHKEAVEESRCKGELERSFEPTPVRYKVGGFYTTDKALHGHTPGDYEDRDNL